MNIKSTSARLFIISLFFCPNSILAQKNNDILVAKNASASFFSEAPLENIEAHNSHVRAALNVKSGEIMAKVPINGFEFEKIRGVDKFIQLKNNTYRFGFIEGEERIKSHFEQCQIISNQVNMTRIYRSRKSFLLEQLMEEILNNDSLFLAVFI